MSRARSLYAFVTLALALALVASAAAGARGAPASQKGVERVARPAASGLPSPQLALQRALALFAPSEVHARYRAAVAGADARAATLVLRDLVAQRAKLGPADRRLADALLARPTDGRAAEGPAGYTRKARRSLERSCNRRFCVHWVERTNERPSLRDRKPNNGRPDYVDRTIANMKDVWALVVGTYNFKRPLRDTRSRGHHGGNPNRKIDIFIANIGDRGLYGYCTTDDPRADPSSHRRNSAYCVIDNDFSPSEFTSGANRDAANKVTLAHEFFHAIQYAYDTFDNDAMMEGTATWMEDQVFTGVNDSRQYFDSSPIGPNPWQSLDRAFNSGPFGLWQYGTWIWYRFLSENLGAGATDSPAIVRQIWVQAAGGARNGFGAIAAALNARGRTVLQQMMTFGEWNATPRAAGHYREANQGAGYPTAEEENIPPLGPSDGTSSVSFQMLRRSNDYLQVDPDPTDPGSTLDFSSVDLPTMAGSVEAIVFLVAGGSLPPESVANGGSVQFDSATVDRVVFIFTNASGTDYVSAPNTFDFDLDVNP